jgi:hypothetical protein
MTMSAISEVKSQRTGGGSSGLKTGADQDWAGGLCKHFRAWIQAGIPRYINNAKPCPVAPPLSDSPALRRNSSYCSMT